MLGRLAAIGALTLPGLLSASCTIKTPDDGRGGSMAMSTPEPTNMAGKGGAGVGGSAGGRGGTEPVKPDPNGPKPEPTDPCEDCDSGYCLKDGTCVECLPSDDQCPTGQYCTDDNACAPGCKDASGCASGVCQEDHSCKHCIKDDECAEGLLCSAGECTALCGAEAEEESSACSEGLTCCSPRCADLSADSKNCGECGNVCGTDQFCGSTACADESGCFECHETTLANVCSVAKVVVILDTNKNTEDGDRAPGLAIGNALAELCPTKPELSETMQDSAEALNLTTGRPVSNSSELLVIAGGPFFQDLEGYLEEQQISPLYWKGQTDATEYRLRKTDQAVVSVPLAGDHDSHDAFIIQFMRDPDSGSLVLNAQGLWLSGTIAAAYQLTNGLLTDLSQQDQAWYAYEWTDQDGDKAPDADEIVLVDSGK